MPYQNIIAAKRDHKDLDTADIAVMVEGISSGKLSDAQLAAFAMTIYLNGMNVRETADLTMAMRDSGDLLSWDVPGPVVDKHSTGGVGDMVSLMLGPMLAACGCYVPMISGRGLGHTGGTVDKLESIPGYQVMPANKRFSQCVRDVGVAIIGQTANLAPADKRFYAIRDHTASVESIPLITASILAKKLSEGISALVMDIKVGNGAFMPTLAMAEKLAECISQVARSVGVNITSLLTDMNSPLAYSVGNALEIRESIDFLLGKHRHPGLEEVVIRLAAEALVLADKANNLEQGLKRAESCLSSGQAAEVFARMVSTLGGPTDLMEQPNKHLAKAPVIKPLLAKRPGFVTTYDAKAVGRLAMTLGAGRKIAGGEINPAVGLNNILPLGSEVAVGAELVEIHAASEQDWQAAAANYDHNCLQIAETPVTVTPRVLKSV